MYGKNFTDAIEACEMGKKFEDENIGMWLEVKRYSVPYACSKS